MDSLCSLVKHNYVGFIILAHLLVMLEKKCVSCSCNMTLKKLGELKPYCRHVHWSVCLHFRIKKEKEEERVNEEKLSRQLIEPRDPVTGETSQEAQEREKQERQFIRQTIREHERKIQKNKEMERYSSRVLFTFFQHMIQYWIHLYHPFPLKTYDQCSDILCSRAQGLNVALSCIVNLPNLGKF